MKEAANSRIDILVEDNPLVTKAVNDCLIASELFTKVLSYSGVRQFNEGMRVSPDLALLDLSLPDGNGLDLVPKLKTANPEIKILVLTVHQEQDTTLEAIKAGVDGFLLKDEPDLGAKVREVLAGNYPIDARVAGYVVEKVAPPKAPPLVRLTMREHQVLDGLSRGKSYAQIAESIKVSENTITGYIKTLYRKLGVNSKNQAVYEGTRLGLVRV